MRIINLTLIICFAVFTQLAHSAIAIYSDFQHLGSDDVDYIIVIEDDQEVGVTTGNFRVTYQVNLLSPNTTGKLTGFFFDAEDPFSAANGPYNAGNLGLINESVTSCGQDFNTNSVSAQGGCNTTLQLGAGAGAFQNHEWDVAIAWKTNDISDSLSDNFEFANLGLSLSDINAIGIRGQATTGMGGSAKEFQATPLTTVPLPTGAWLFGSALAAFSLIRRRR